MSDLDHYRNPGGWVEFWVGLAALIFISVFCGRIIYLEEMVKKGDAEFKAKIQLKSKPNSPTPN
jgi:hypothetical protein